MLLHARLTCLDDDDEVCTCKTISMPDETLLDPMSRPPQTLVGCGRTYDVCAGWPANPILGLAIYRSSFCLSNISCRYAHALRLSRVGHSKAGLSRSSQADSAGEYT